MEENRLIAEKTDKNEKDIEISDYKDRKIIWITLEDFLVKKSLDDVKRENKSFSIEEIKADCISNLLDNKCEKIRKADILIIPITSSYNPFDEIKKKIKKYYEKIILMICDKRIGDYAFKKVKTLYLDNEYVSNINSIIYEMPCTFSFKMQHKEHDWKENGKYYISNLIKRQNLMIILIKHPDSTLEITISEPSYQTFTFREKIPKVNSPVITVSIIWTLGEVKLFLNDQYMAKTNVKSIEQDIILLEIKGETLLIPMNVVAKVLCQLSLIFNSLSAFLCIKDMVTLQRALEFNLEENKFEIQKSDTGSYKPIIQAPKKVIDFCKKNFMIILALSYGLGARLAKTFVEREENKTARVEFETAKVGFDMLEKGLEIMYKWVSLTSHNSKALSENTKARSYIEKTFKSEEKLSDELKAKEKSILEDMNIDPNELYNRLLQEKLFELIDELKKVLEVSNLTLNIPKE